MIFIVSWGNADQVMRNFSGYVLPLVQMLDAMGLGKRDIDPHLKFLQDNYLKGHETQRICRWKYGEREEKDS